MILREIRSLYNSARTVYSDPFHAKIAIGFWFSFLLVPAWTLFASSPAGSSPDYSVLVAWLIIVPILAMVMLNYHFVLKPGLEKRRLRKIERAYS